jgi:hypothetical protein
MQMLLCNAVRQETCNIFMNAYFPADVNAYFPADVNAYFPADVNAYFPADVNDYFPADVNAYFPADLELGSFPALLRALNCANTRLIVSQACKTKLVNASNMEYLCVSHV